MAIFLVAAGVSRVSAYGECGDPTCRAEEIAAFCAFLAVDEALLEFGSVRKGRFNVASWTAYSSLVTLAIGLGCAPQTSALEEVSKELPDQPRAQVKVVRGPAPDLPTVEESAPKSYVPPPGIPGPEAGKGSETPPAAEPAAETPAGPGPRDPYESPAVRFTGEEVVFLGKVSFEGTALAGGSAAVLDEVAAMMVARPAIERLEIQVHVDAKAKGDRSARTQERALAVRDHLVSKGVAEGRLVAKGYGSDMPIDSNRTAEGRAANRRVEFVLLELGG
jgi:outer membrane protein OmpA-like peptidoglycan-associated protein